MDNLRREYEVVPGIYLTPPSSSGGLNDSDNPAPISPEAYIESLRSQGLLIEPIIATERKRLESLIRKLQETNEELREEEDEEMRVVVRENEGVIRKYQRMIEMLEKETEPVAGVFL